MELNLHYEARGESLAGKKAVANVTINRVKSKKFPNTVCSVVKQPYQFSWVKMFPDYAKTKVADPQIKQIAYDSILSRKWKDNTNGALFFHNNTVDDFKRKKVAVIGNHKFYK
jgi:spore germination cell wall hydrolase CwlJ-like protein